MKKYYQQGDVILKPVKEIPAGLKKRKSLVLAEGEATGHRHQALGNAELFEQEEERKLFLIVHSEGATIRHEEHLPIDMPPGVFQISIVREYDHFDEEAREVVD